MKNKYKHEKESPPEISDRFWLFFITGALIVGGLISLFYGFRRGFGGEIERDFTLRLLFGGGSVLGGIFILIFYWDLNRSSDKNEKEYHKTAQQKYRDDGE